MTVIKQKNDNKVITNTQILPGSRDDNFYNRENWLGPNLPYFQSRVSLGQKVCSKNWRAPLTDRSISAACLTWWQQPLVWPAVQASYCGKRLSFMWQQLIEPPCWVNVGKEWYEENNFVRSYDIWSVLVALSIGEVTFFVRGQKTENPKKHSSEKRTK